MTPSFLCAPPLYATCSEEALACRDSETACAGTPGELPRAFAAGPVRCGAVGFDSGLRLCPCFDPAQPMLPCMGNEPTISAAGGIYFIDGSSSPIGYGDGHRTLSITAGEAHPLRFIHEGGLHSACRRWRHSSAAHRRSWRDDDALGPNDGGVTYEYYYGNWAATFPSDAACHRTR